MHSVHLEYLNSSLCSTQTLVKLSIHLLLKMYYFLANRLHRPCQQIVTKVQILNYFWSCAAAKVWYLCLFVTSWLKLFGDYVYLLNTNSFTGSKTLSKRPQYNKTKSLIVEQMWWRATVRTLYWIIAIIPCQRTFVFQVKSHQPAKISLYRNTYPVKNLERAEMHCRMITFCPPYPWPRHCWS